MSDMCSFPGCVAQAPCAVHGKEIARHACEQCYGRGTYFYQGQGLEMACQICGGTGLKDKRASAPRVSKRDDPIDKRELMQLMKDE